MMDFEFATATRILFGAGSVQKIGPLAAGMGKRALLVTGVGLERAKVLQELLALADIESLSYPVESEPTVEIVRQGVALAAEGRIDLVIGLGGGSALDAGKAIAALRPNPGEISDYLEVVGLGRPLVLPPLPYIAVPTTAGTGSEVTRNAVLSVPERRVKVSLRSLEMLPRLALVDPELTYTLPPEVTASTGLDALTQLMEPFVSNRANPITDALCRDGMERAARSLRRAFEHGSDPNARQDMSLASLFGGLALANARLGAVHGFAGVLGGMFPAPHGVICARLLPFVMDANIQVMHKREPTNPALQRYAEVARILTGDPRAVAEDGVAWVRTLCAALMVSPLAAYGLTESDFSDVIEKSAKASSMRGNPIRLTADELRQILEQAL